VEVATEVKALKKVTVSKDRGLGLGFTPVCCASDFIGCSQAMLQTRQATEDAEGFSPVAFFWDCADSLKRFVHQAAKETGFLQPCTGPR